MKDVHRKRKVKFTVSYFDGEWWFNAKEIIGSQEDEWRGGYCRRKDALEAARSLRDNGSQRFTTRQICTGSK